MILFTCYCWIDNEPHIAESVVCVSDELRHEKHSVHAFMTKIFSYLVEKYPDIENIDVFSDGATSQFKQRYLYLFSNLTRWQDMFDVQVQWHFFATAHGKGVVDGLGGTVKRSVWRYIRAEKAFPKDAVDFSKVAIDRNPNVTFFLIPSSEIYSDCSEIDYWWERVRPIPNLQSVRFVKTCGSRNILDSNVSQGARFTCAMHSSLTTMRAFFPQTTTQMSRWIIVTCKSDHGL